MSSSDGDEVKILPRFLILSGPHSRLDDHLLLNQSILSSKARYHPHASSTAIGVDLAISLRDGTSEVNRIVLPEEMFTFAKT